PAHIIHRSPFALLNVLSAGRALLGSTLDQLQKIGFTCRFIDDEPTLMWGKLVFLAPFALSTTAADKTVGEILSDPEWRSLGLACVREACAVGVAEGAKVDPEKVLAGVGRCRETCAALCKKMWNATIRRSWMRSQGRSCVALASMELKFQPRKSWLPQWNGERDTSKAGWRRVWSFCGYPLCGGSGCFHNFR